MVSNPLPIMTRSVDPSHRDDGEFEFHRLRQFIINFRTDYDDLNRLQHTSLYRSGAERVEQYVSAKFTEFKTDYPFESLHQGGKVDWLLMSREFQLLQKGYQVLSTRIDNIDQFLGPWFQHMMSLCERGQSAALIEAREAADKLHAATTAVHDARRRILQQRESPLINQITALKATASLAVLHQALKAWHTSQDFFDPTWIWWVDVPLEDFCKALADLVDIVNRVILGVEPSAPVPAVGLPVGKDGLRERLDMAMIPYSPEELIRIGEQQVAHHERELARLSRAAGFRDWREALSSAQNDLVEPGHHMQLVRQYTQETLAFVRQYDLVTVPDVAAITGTMRRVAINPSATEWTLKHDRYDDDIAVVCPAGGMTHKDKVRSLQSNRRSSYRLHVVHETIPGSRLHAHFAKRYHPHRHPKYDNSWAEAWGLYWDLVLCDHGFFASLEDGLEMHSTHLRRWSWLVTVAEFHLGQLTPQQCVHKLVAKTGDDPRDLETKVRHALNHQNGILEPMDGVLLSSQLYALKKEVVDTGMMNEKQFHDRILRENAMPVELLRALLKDEPLERSHQPAWRFFTFDENHVDCA